MKKDVALALLGLSDENPTDDEVNAAYKAAMQMNHPDRYASNERLRKHAEEQSKLINEAREVLLNGTWEHGSRSGGTPRPSAPSEEPRDYGSYNPSDSFRTEQPGARDGSAKRDSPPSGQKASSHARKKPVGFGKGKIAVVAVVFALVVLVAVPAEISPSKETVQSMQARGEVVSVDLVGKSEGFATFTVTSSTGDFDVDVDMDLPSDVGIGSSGYVCCESGALQFDGHDDREYVFLLSRQANLAQSILANLGLVEDCRSLPGRITEEEDVLFVPTSASFSADFPVKPLVSDSSEGVATIKDFVGDSLRSKHFTIVRYVESPNVYDAFGGQGEDIGYANLAGIVSQTLDGYSEKNGMTPGVAAYEFSYKEEDNYLFASTIAPFTMPADSLDGTECCVYLYALSAADSARWCTLVGLRDTYEEAEEALASFRPRGEERLWG